jgi:hypothetical protein
MVSNSLRRVWTQTRNGKTESVWNFPDGTMRMIATEGNATEAEEREIAGKMIAGRICLLCYGPTEDDHLDTCMQCAQREIMLEDLLHSHGWRKRLKEMLDTADKEMRR